MSRAASPTWAHRGASGRACPATTGRTRPSACRACGPGSARRGRPGSRRRASRPGSRPSPARSRPAPPTWVGRWRRGRVGTALPERIPRSGPPTAVQARVGHDRRGPVVPADGLLTPPDLLGPNRRRPGLDLGGVGIVGAGTGLILPAWAGREQAAVAQKVEIPAARRDGQPRQPGNEPDRRLAAQRRRLRPCLVPGAVGAPFTPPELGRIVLRG